MDKAQGSNNRNVNISNLQEIAQTRGRRADH